MIFESASSEILLLGGRVLFGGVLAFMGLNHFGRTEQMAALAESKGVPLPTLSVALSGLLLVGGGIGIAIGVFPVIAAALITVFFAVTTPTMHDFWRAEGEQRRQELTHFLKNVVLLGAALAFVAFGQESWGYAVGIGL
jgi:uncharacterized membrane protein YphA (DoxX/SURF4 family)